MPGAAPGAAVPAKAPLDNLDADARAALDAKRTGKAVEVVSRRTADTETFANPSGTMTLVEHAVPVRVQRNGTWVPIDTTLAATGDGVRPAASTVDIRFSTGGRDPLVTVTRGGVTFGLTWPDALPRPSLSADTATYPNVYPDVDLVLRAERSGYAKFLVVKTRAAAADPRVRTVHFGLIVRGGTAVARPGGGVNVLDGKGTTVLASDAAAMWDDPRPPADQPKADVEDWEPAHSTTMPLTLTGDRVTIVPDPAFLDDPATVYPIRIDPSSTAIGDFDWTHVNDGNKNTSYWDSDRTSAKVGYSGWPGGNNAAWRSMFNFQMSPLFGKSVTWARFSIDLDHSGSCGPTEADLFLNGVISRGSAATWNTTLGMWGNMIGYASGNANEAGGCSGGNQPDLHMQFDHWLITQTVQRGAAGEFGNHVTLGLKAPNEGDKYQWKKFFPWSAVLSVEYNTPPTLPAELSTVPASSCGSSGVPTRLGATMLTPSFSAVLRDDDANLVTGELQILAGSSETVVYPAAPAGTANTARVARGATAVWPSVPAGVLQPNTVYSYRARTNDGNVSGAWSNRCYFVVDSVGPLTPSIESADFPDWTPVKDMGQPGTVTFHNASADTDVAGFYYGFQADSLTGWVPADDGGDATVPMTLWRNPNTGTPDSELYVQAADRSGNRSPVTGPHMMLSNDTGAVPPGKTGDVNGDGKGDVTALFDMGEDRLRAWTITSTGTGFHTSYVGWDTGRDGSSFVTMRAVAGEFTGDGLADQALFRQDPDGRTRLFILRSSGHRLDVMGEPVWTSPADAQWNLANLKIVSGNFDGTGPDDVAALVNAGNGGWSAYVWPGGSGLATPSVWFTQAGGSPWSAMTTVAGDFDADGRADLANIQDAGNLGLSIWVHGSTGTAFTVGALRYSSGANNFDYRRGRFVTGNVDGDTTNGRGRADIVAIYDYGNNQSRLIAFTSNGASGFTSPFGWPTNTTAAQFDSRTADLLATDFNGDGTSDVVVITDCCAVGNKELWVIPSTGTAFGAIQRIQEINVSDKRIARARWKLDAGSGTSVFDEYGDFPATTAGAPTWRIGRTGTPTDKAMQFSGNQWAATAGPPVRTDRSFSVSAWVYLEEGASWHGAISQDGNVNSAFFLRYSSSGQWVFTLVSSDAQNGANTNLYSNRTAVLRQWTHLTGVYDAAAGEMRLYVNGVLDNATPWSGTFNAFGPLNIGRDKYNGGTWNTWVGGIDDVQIVNYVLTGYEIATLANAARLDGQWKLGNPDGGADATGNGRTLTFAGGPTTTTDRAGNPNGALAFNGTNQVGSTAGPVVTGGSFSVAAWVKLDQTGGLPWPAAVSQVGVHGSLFFLRYSGPNNQWVFTVVAEDAVNAPHTNLLAPQPVPQAGVWTHLAGVYDAGSRTISLYVNGVLRATDSVAGAFHSTGAVRIGSDRWNDGVWTWWKGGIDDVRLYSGALSQDEVKAIAAAAP